MLAVLSPAKKLDADSAPPSADYSQPRFLEDATALAQDGARMGAAHLQGLMHLSDALAEKTYQGFKAFSPPFDPTNAKPAIFTFKGDVYQGLDADHLDADGLAHAQKHLRILSGLYGLLRPLDLMQPYRLEMGTRFKTTKAADLYGFWGDKITKALARDLQEDGHDCLINLASQEYFKAVDPKALGVPVYQIDFREDRDGQFRMISFFAKKARGLMARYIAVNKIERAEDLKDFDLDGYRFAPKASKPHHWTFLRPDSRS
ncbi:UPF0246 protein [Iodidimonas nitroreducens]|uniref:UPF0246 protein JCM17846_26070 n=1 Tax=Iodidimonas nitroreducens TaxID=1236968 RepID=A0A5A7NBA3_9PROT|nr:peroxide stress protein YaaA [Iodidimonas nitroreducens]GAK32735.1 hypothetical protein AQ1_00605 [alpha proteobacterium Q-1]GER04925.1 UPF0246 protein [Iodidimonas nitroreducens]